MTNSRLQSLRVLVVEDEMLLALDYEEMLRAEGCTVLGPVGRESEALDLLGQSRPDAAILDLNLGGNRPDQLARALFGAGVPFLVISGYGARHDAEEPFRAAPHLDKPLHRDSLIKALAGLARPDHELG